MMSLRSGTRLGPYEVVRAIGAGGMGEVYHARDTTLHRDVAIKVLPDAVAGDPDRLARFEREAQLLAALNHPNIATIYGVERSASGGRALAMELVEGPTLADRVAQGAVSLSDALGIARQIADALEAAHEKGIIHRDLKPANVKVTSDGAVKVLDFGLAKSIAGVGAAVASDASQSPTFMPASVEGVILGTAAYMSPEQASGRAVDRRADIWAFGAVVFEMLSGRPLVRGETTAHLLAEVLKTDPPWDALPKTTPREVRDLLERCLRKNPRARLREIGDARILIEEWLARPEKTRFAAPQPDRDRRWPSLALAAGSLVIAAAAVVFALWQTPPVSAPSRTWDFPLGDASPDVEWMEGPVISPDGHMIAVGGGGPAALRVRDIDTLTFRELAGTEGAGMPFWSPDSTFIGYRVGRGLQSALWKVPARGGPPTRICDVPPGGLWGASWGGDRVIVLSVVQGPKAAEFFTVPDRGGTPPVPLKRTESDKDAPLFFPLVLPTGDLLYNRGNSDPSSTNLELVLRRTTGETLVVHTFKDQQGLIANTVQGGYLLHSPAPGQGIWATPFDAGRARFTGEPTLLDQKGRLPSASADGTLVYKSLIGGSRQLAWVDRTGALLGSIGQPQEEIFAPSLSTDGTRVAVSASENDVVSVWIHDVVRGTKSRLDAGSPYVEQPVWAPGGDRLAANVNWDIAVLDVEATRPPQTVAGGAVVQMEPSWSRDGRYIFFSVYDGKSDIWFREANGGSAAQKFLATPANERLARLAPDGRHLAYVSDESGRNEIYVREFPSGQKKQLVSVNGGFDPKWSPQGDELFFVANDTLMAAPVERTPALSTGVPKALFTAASIGAAWIGYDVAADGKRFVVVRTLKAPERRAVVVENWPARVAGQAGRR